MHKTIKDMVNMKSRAEKIAMITCYDSTFAKIIENTSIDCILVGDSLGNTMLGFDNTLSVSLDDMIRYTSAVTRSNKQQFIIADMPFMSYHVNTAKTVKNAGRLIKEAGAHAIKLEGGSEFKDDIEALTRAQITVVSHLGLTPQSVNVFGGYSVQGKNEADAKKLIEDALIVQKAGAKMLVLECVPAQIAEHIAKTLSIPVIGIGAGALDGQVLVLQDLLGLNNKVPKFVKKYANLLETVSESFEKYASDVKIKRFPDKSNIYTLDDKSVLSSIEKLY